MPALSSHVHFESDSHPSTPLSDNDYDSDLSENSEDDDLSTSPDGSKVSLDKEAHNLLSDSFDEVRIPGTAPLMCFYSNLHSLLHNCH